MPGILLLQGTAISKPSARAILEGSFAHPTGWCMRESGLGPLAIPGIHLHRHTGMGSWVGATDSG
jgi:hypothetical protein